MRDQIGDIKAMLVARVETLVPELLPDGFRSGKSWMARCPWRADTRPGSFAVFLYGDRAGGWKDFATDETGDLLHLIAGCETGDPRNLNKALIWARDRLGLGSMTDAQRAEFVESARTRQADFARDQQTTERKERGRALAWWLGCDRIKGTAAASYLRTRGIDIEALRHIPSALRFDMPRIHHESGEEWPAMIAGMTATRGEASGHIVAVHRTFIRPDGSGKAPITPTRKMWPRMQGAVIQLARGTSGLELSQARKKGVTDDTLCLCEGIEDGLTIALARPEWRVWAVASLSNLSHVRISQIVGHVVIARDNDWGKPQAADAFRKGLSSVVRQVADVRVVTSWTGKDFNDALMGAA